MFRSLSARLTFLYTLLFALLSLIVFKYSEHNLEQSLMKRVDTELLIDGRECLGIYQSQGLAGLEQEILLETTGAGNEHIFMRVYSPDFKMVASSDLSRWEGLPTHSKAAEKARQSAFQTVTLAGPTGDHVRVFFQDLEDGHLLQFGKLLRANKQLLNNYRSVFYISFLIMLLGGVLFGSYVAKRALAGIQRVQRGADRMSSGNLSERIPLLGGGVEIESLSYSFNQMQDRIGHLVSELRDVTNNIAHDLRSPITRMRGMAETTLTGDQSLEDYRDLAGAVVEESDRLVGMINVMLEIAETDAGLRQTTDALVDLKEIILDVTELYTPVAQDKGIAMHTNLPEDTLLIRGDRSNLQRALANLLDNALKFTPEGGHVTFTAISNGPRVLTTVTDNGPGIPKSDLPRVYDRFFRGDQSRSKPGSGLGLSLVQAIVRAHGGEIHIDNHVPTGTQVSLSFPKASV